MTVIKSFSIFILLVASCFGAPSKKCGEKKNYSATAIDNQAVKDCLTKFGLTEIPDAAKVKALGSSATDKDGKCFFKCGVEAISIAKNGKIDLKFFEEQLKSSPEGKKADEAVIKEVLEKFDGCMKSTNDKAKEMKVAMDSCEYFIEYADCMQNLKEDC